MWWQYAYSLDFEYNPIEEIIRSGNGNYITWASTPYRDESYTYSDNYRGLFRNNKHTLNTIVNVNADDT